MDDIEYWQTYQQWEEYTASLVNNLQKSGDLN
jgi:hypothetical protein